MSQLGRNLRVQDIAIKECVTAIIPQSRYVCINAIQTERSGRELIWYLPATLFLIPSLLKRKAGLAVGFLENLLEHLLSPLVILSSPARQAYGGELNE